MHPMLPAPELKGRRLAAACAIALVHLLLVLVWRPPAPPPVQADAASTDFVWVELPPLARPAPAAPSQERQPARRASTAAERAIAPIPEAAAEPGADAGAEPGDDATQNAEASAQAILERARRDAGAIDRALRKENNAVIVAPPDSPQLRLRRGMEEAADLAPNAAWQAPKMADMVNQTADGARRTRVIGGRGTYCVTERSPITAIETIERHGRTRITNCPQHESPASKQTWKTARD